MENEIKTLKKQINNLKLSIFGFGGLLLSLMLISFYSRKDTKNIITTQGIIVQDSLGRDRMLIGSPAPYSKNRVRTDYDKVKKVWATKMGGDSYMDYYKDYDHEVSGIVFLNESGYDRLVIGDKHPDPNVGKRQVSPVGITWNDEEGFERGGLGITKTEEGKYRVMLGMDDDKSQESLHMFVLEDGTKALRISYKEGYILLGKATPGNFLFQNENDFSGILIKDKNGKTLWKKNALMEEKD